MMGAAATACRVASHPERNSVPSPRFWKICGVFENGAMPAHCTPSPPICVMSRVLRSYRCNMLWQPVPPPLREPSGTRVERLSGQPEQKYGGGAGGGGGGGGGGGLRGGPPPLVRGGRPP